MIQKIKLRDYQEKGITDLYHKWKFVKRLILWSQMGSGKSEMASYIAQEACNDDLPVIMIVRGRELVKNLSNRLDKYNIDHSVFMAGHYKMDRKKLIQICSIDTMISRKDFINSDKQCLLILDECHKDYSIIFEKYPIQYILGMTATPFSDMSNYQDFVQPLEPFELRDSGVLVPEKVYCPHVIDTSTLNIVAGDFKRDQVAQLVTQGEIVGNIIQDYKDYGEDRPAVCFAVNIEHSKQLRDKFINEGIPAIHCDASSSDDERKKAHKDLENGKIKVLCNVDIFSVGWDCPMVSCVILARPTWSLTWYLQAVGRGLRSFPNKKNCIILDNAGNVYRHGLPYRSRDISLKKTEKKKSKLKDDITIRHCGECLAVYDSKMIVCPYCGAEKQIRTIKKVDGILREYKETEEESNDRKIRESQIAFYKLKHVATKNHLSDKWIKNEIEKKYGQMVLPYIEELLRIKSK